MRGEWVSLAGLRGDGRRPEELRRVRCALNTIPGADGSARLEQGQTVVLAVVDGPKEVSRRADTEHDKAIIEVHYCNAPFSGLDRKKRRSGDRKSLEVALAVKQTFEAAVLRHLYPRTQIDIHLTLLQNDGSALCACINAATLALMDAGIAMVEMVAACSVAYLDGHIVLDVNNMESASGLAHMPVAALPARQESESRLDVSRFEEMVRGGMRGGARVAAIMEEEVKEHHRRLTGHKAATFTTTPAGGRSSTGSSGK